MISTPWTAQMLQISQTEFTNILNSFKGHKSLQLIIKDALVLVVKLSAMIIAN